MECNQIQWTDGQVVRSCAIRMERSDPAGWQAFLEHLRDHAKAANGFLAIFEELGWVAYSVEKERLVLTILMDSDKEGLLRALDPDRERASAEDTSSESNPGTVMYIEEKPGLTGHARIGRVRFSASGKTIYYAGRKLRSLKGGYKANYFDVESGLRYWLSNCRKDGEDTLYPGIVEIDEDAREEYWMVIRKLPENVRLTRFRSEGKYSKRRPS